MIEDQIIEELHRVRDELAAEFNYDLHAIVADLRRRQQAENRQVVSLPPKRIALKTPLVINVIANNDYTLTITFSNGEVGRFDVSPYLGKGVFQELKDLSYFKQVKVAMGAVQWPHQQDFCLDTLYEESEKVAVAAD
jgi:hypothetical protein